MVPIFWHKPPEGNFKLNFDGSFESQTTNGGTGGVIRNQLGTWIVGFACKIKA
uniref:RNase H type-1 domain-containing protein n=1 Tax=Solanum tuberosum TaxID=4113 RepID=M1AZZ1_SOLTU